MLEFCDITVRFGTRTILQNVSFGLPEGKLTVLLGPNGSGKSTLIGCVNQQTPFRGQILSGGRDLAGISARERAKQIAILPQTLTAPPHYRLGADGPGTKSPSGIERPPDRSRQADH